MCVLPQTICWGPLEVQQTCGVISVDESVRFDELRFPHKITDSLAEAPEDTSLLIAQAMHLKATYDTIYRHLQANVSQPDAIHVAVHGP